MDFLGPFVLFLAAILAFMWVQSKVMEVEFVTSAVDGRRYLVRKLPDSQAAADIIARVNAKNQQLIKAMIAQHTDNPAVRRLYERYNPDSLSEGSPDSGYTSYSVNKGEKIVLCVRQSDLSFVDFNVLLYVTIHELAHLMTASTGHTKEFWDNNKFLLGQAVKLGLYEKTDYGASPVAYCGIRIQQSVI
jgi:hypothetical protein